MYPSFCGVAEHLLHPVHAGILIKLLCVSEIPSAAGFLFLRMLYPEIYLSGKRHGVAVTEQIVLTEGKEPQTQPAVCTCAEKCEASSVKMDCEVCKNDRSGCVGKEPAAEEPKEEPKEKGGLNPALILLPLLLIGGGGAFYYFKFIKDKSSTKGNDDLGEYDFEDEYEDTEVEYLDDTPKEDESV